MRQIGRCETLFDELNALTDELVTIIISTFDVLALDNLRDVIEEENQGRYVHLSKNLGQITWNRADCEVQNEGQYLDFFLPCFHSALRGKLARKEDILWAGEEIGMVQSKEPQLLV